MKWGAGRKSAPSGPGTVPARPAGVLYHYISNVVFCKCKGGIPVLFPKNPGHFGPFGEDFRKKQHFLKIFVDFTRFFEPFFDFDPSYTINNIIGNRQDGRQKRDRPLSGPRVTHSAASVILCPPPEGWRDPGTSI